MNKVKPFAVVLFLLVMLPLLLQAQTNYKSGYVITATGDSLSGLIDYREWAQAPSSISFKAAATSATVTEYTPVNCRYFAVEGQEAYQQYIGPITMDNVELSKLNDGASASSVTDTVFLRVDLKGRYINLLSYTDRIKTRLFVQEKGSKPQELFFRRYYSQNTSSAVVLQRSYVGQLLSLAKKYNTLTPKLQNQTESADYKLHVLQTIVGKINGESAQQIAQNEKQSRNTRFFVGAGLNRSMLEISGDHRLSGAESSPSYMPRVAVGFDAFINKNVQKTVLRVELAVTAGDYSLQKIETIGNNYNELTYQVSQQTASLVPQILYNLYNTDRFKAYIGVGAVLNYSHYTKNKYSNQYVNPSRDTQSKPIEIDNYLELESTWAYYAFKAGVVLNRKYEVTLSYQPPATITRYTNFAVQTGSWAVGLNYLLGK